MMDSIIVHVSRANARLHPRFGRFLKVAFKRRARQEIERYVRENGLFTRIVSVCDLGLTRWYSESKEERYALRITLERDGRLPTTQEVADLAPFYWNYIPSWIRKQMRLTLA